MPPLPAVTVLMPSYNSAAYVADALASVLAQTLRDIEVLVVDDASTDASAAIVAAAATQDKRLRLIRSAVNGGPASARNLGLEQARGRWIAVMDSDDLIHPERLERLLQAAETHGSDIAADNLLIFDDDPAVPARAFATDAADPRQVDLAAYVLANAYGRAGPKTGYLKPLFRTAFVRGCGARYQPALQVAQDFSFVRLLLGAGARFHVFPDLTYFYRKHAGSNSHRLSRPHIAAMMADDARFLEQLDAPSPALLQAFAARSRGFDGALAFDDLVQALKARRWLGAAGLALSRPHAAFHMWQPLADRFKRLQRPHRSPVNASFSVCLVVRTLSTPMRGVAQALAAEGNELHLVTFSPKWRKGLAAGTFASVAVGNGEGTGTGWSTAEKLFIAIKARAVANAVIVEGSDGIDALPFVLRPNAWRIVLIDDPSRPRTELLSGAAAILTRPDLAAALRRACPAVPIILLPTRAAYDAVALPAPLAALLR